MVVWVGMYSCLQKLLVVCCKTKKTIAKVSKKEKRGIFESPVCLALILSFCAFVAYFFYYIVNGRNFSGK